jgi:hypothetical protein
MIITEHRQKEGKVHVHLIRPIIFLRFGRTWNAPTQEV